MRALLDDLTLGRLCLHVLARRGGLPFDALALRRDMVAAGRHALLADGPRLARCVDLMLGLHTDPHVLARLGEVAAESMDGDQPGLVRIAARHMVWLRGEAPVPPGALDEHLGAWLAGVERVPRARSGDLRRVMDRHVQAVRGEQAIGLGEAYQLDLCAAQLSALADVAPERVEALVRLLRREPTLSAALIRRNLK